MDVVRCREYPWREISGFMGDRGQKRGPLETNDRPPTIRTEMKENERVGALLTMVAIAPCLGRGDGIHRGLANS